VATYAISLKGFPERSDDDFSVSSYAAQTKYHGHKLVL
jgi:hypothetical protein